MAMDGVFYLMSIVGVGCVMWWVLQNDRVPPDRPTIGMFAMVPGAKLVKRRGLRGWLEAVAKPAKRKSPF
jgi:hypothetical protein